MVSYCRGWTVGRHSALSGRQFVGATVGKELAGVLDHQLQLALERLVGVCRICVVRLVSFALLLLLDNMSRKYWCWYCLSYYSVGLSLMVGVLRFCMKDWLVKLSVGAVVCFSGHKCCLEELFCIVVFVTSLWCLGALSFRRRYYIVWSVFTHCLLSCQNVRLSMCSWHLPIIG